MVSVECPVEGCDYSAPVESVEGHLSASTDGDHEGRLGLNHRQELVERAEEKINGEATDTPKLSKSPDVTETDDRSESGEKHSDDGPPVPPGKALVASTIGLIALALGTTTDAETSVEAADDQGGEQTADSGGWPGDDLDGGLIDG